MPIDGKFARIVGGGGGGGMKGGFAHPRYMVLTIYIKPPQAYERLNDLLPM